MKNYYFILGVSTNATSEEIRAAYRQQAKDLQPDYYGQDSEPFFDLQEAYAILSDPARRRAYDDVRGQTPSRRTSHGPEVKPLVPQRPIPEPLIPTDESVDLGDLSILKSFETIRPSFDELFDRLWENFSPTRPKVEQLQSLNVEIRLSPHEALRGGRVRLWVPAQIRCPVCRGCGGIGFFSCWQCEGAGVVQGEYPVTIAFPCGIMRNYVIQVPLDRFGITNFYLNMIFRVGE